MRRPSSITWVAVAALGILSSAGPAAASAPDPSLNMTGAKQRGMRNCPSRVPGATTELRERKGVLELRITASDPRAIESIRTLARGQARILANMGEVQHTGTGTGGGAFGYCPIPHGGAEAVVENIEGGVRVLVRPENLDDLETFRDIMRARIAALPRGSTPESAAPAPEASR